MRHATGRTMRVWAAALLGVFVATACVDEKVVYRDVNAVVAPPTAAQGFVGYSRQADTQTVCANCHAGAGANWKGTKHARAWADLQATGRATKACEGCHSVNALGNATVGDAGWVATGDTRYQDVQCEACHGPGLTHVSSPSKGNVPLASLLADSTRTDGCGECHRGTHNPFVAEWAQSNHSRMPNSPYPRKRVDCQRCHTGQGALVAMGVTANYKERSMAKDTLGIVCGVCHDPHQKRFEGQLRMAVDDPDPDRNLCVNCHHKRGTPDPVASRGPHSPEGPMVLGEAGWWPPNVAADSALTRIYGSHGPGANKRLCATCHMERYSVTDKATGAFKINSVGHRFIAIPCVDAAGYPTASQNCATDTTSAAGYLTTRRFNACATGGCHGTPDAAKSAAIASATRTRQLRMEIQRLIAQIPKSELSGTDGRWTTAEGADWNRQLADGRMWMASSVHNPFLLETLLRTSIEQLKKDYPTIKSVSTIDLSAQMEKPARLR
ncbi:MAG: cytochrome c3 family protein [Gemmatimonadaceae bacterium]